MPFRVGPTELIIVLVIIMIIFGVGKLPSIGGALGKSIREFRKGQTDLSIDGPEKSIDETSAIQQDEVKQEAEKK